MEAPRKCPKCAEDLVAAPLAFTLAYVCDGCGLVLARAQDAERVLEELAALRAGQRRDQLGGFPHNIVRLYRSTTGLEVSTALERGSVLEIAARDKAA